MIYQVTTGDKYAKAACNYAHKVDSMQVQSEISFDPREDGEVYERVWATDARDELVDHHDDCGR
jgi:hypothetical protein